MALSPMMQQYERIKAQHQDKILFFRLGDFYEMFFDDALTASRELELTLTGRDCGLAERAPMCGVPYHSAEGYIAKLIEKGYKVAICEQITDPKAKGIVERDVVRIVTRGTALESSLLQEERNNFLCSLYMAEDTVGLAFADISCGMVYVCEITQENPVQTVCAEIARFSPTEVIGDSCVLSFVDLSEFLKQNIPCSFELMDSDVYEMQKAQKLLKEQFGDKSKVLSTYKSGVLAVGALLNYVNETQKRNVSNLVNIEPYDIGSYMRLSPLTRSHLEITRTMRTGDKRGSLLGCIDKSKTAMGHRKLRMWFEQPLQSESLINRRLDAVEELKTNTMLLTDIVELLAGISDMERTLTRIVYKSAMPREVYAFANTLSLLPKLKSYVGAFSSPELSTAADLMSDVQFVAELIYEVLEEKLPATLKDGGVIREGYNAEADELRSLSNGARERMEQLELHYKEEYGIKNLRISYNRVFGYYIEVTKTSLQNVPDSFIRRQTLASCERYVTEELKELESRIMGAQEQLLRLETEMYTALLEDIAQQSARLLGCANAIATVDVLCCFAVVADAQNYCRPTVDNSSVLLINGGRHPVVEQHIGNMQFVPNDTKADCGQNRILLITGPNMAGKSTYMRQNALIVLLAHVGCFVPAMAAHIGICDSIFTRVGASDDLASGQSTFMVEMNEMAQILQGATSRSLLILDEIGRGTSTFDGLAIARAIVEYLAGNEYGVKPKTMFATHYHELCSLEHVFYGIRNYSITAKKRGDQLIFLRKIVAKAADDSYGIDVAKLAGIPQPIISRAQEVLKELEMHSEALSGAALQLTMASQPVKEDGNSALQQIVKNLKNCDPQTLSPLEAWQLIANLKNLAQNEEVNVGDNT